MKRSYAYVILAIMIVAAAFVIPANANVSGKSPMENLAAGTENLPKIEKMSFIEAPVGYILQSLGRMYDINFSISTGVSAMRVSVEFNNLTFTQALHMISQASGILIVPAGDKMFTVLTKGEESLIVSDIEREKTRRETTFRESVVDTVDVKYVKIQDIHDSVVKTLGSEAGSMIQISPLASQETRNYNTLLIGAPNMEIMNRVKAIIKSVDRPRPMVDIEVLFVELIDSDTKETGVDVNISTSPFTFQEVNVPYLDDLFKPSAPWSFGKFYRMTPWQAEAAIKAIQATSKSRVLADPKIRVMSGRTAVFASETQVPILSKNNDGDITTEWKNVGIHLEVLPNVLSDNTINLIARPRASAITGEKRLGDVVAPVISERKAETEILMRPGETMVIGGLMSDKEIKTLSKVPFLGDLPLIGNLFKSNKKENEKSTVVIFLRPRLVEEQDVLKSEHEARVDEVLRARDMNRDTSKPSAISSESVSRTITPTDGGFLVMEKTEKTVTPATITDAAPVSKGSIEEVDAHLQKMLDEYYRKRVEEMNEKK